MKSQHIKKKIIRQEKKKRRIKAKKKKLNFKKNKVKNIIFSLHKTIIHNFPDLYERMRKINDCRKNSHYELAELITACIVMFIFKKGSRNAMNNERESKRFKKNYERIFKMRLPHMDTVDEVMRQINESELENLKTELVKNLIMRKVFYKFRFFEKYYRVAVDGTHVINVKEGHCEHCSKRTSKNGKTTYFHNVLEAKLICNNGFSISLATEWIENLDENYDKQDCEQKAFIRLAHKLKQAYQRLPICIVADALYPNQSFFKICRDNDWCWVVTFKDGNLPSVWEEVLDLKKINKENIRSKDRKQNNNNIKQQYTWINDIDYKGILLSWYECKETENDKQRRFVYVSNLPIDYFNILEMTRTGRLRWKIENEGFDIQKNHGYGLGHKYSRVSMTAMKNYYQCMQIAHMLNQLFELSTLFKPLDTGKRTIVHIWSVMLGELRAKLKFKVLEQLLNTRIQIRYG